MLCGTGSVIMADATDLQAFAIALLDAAAEALDTLPGFDTTLDGAPDRQFVSPGRPALEGCDQLTVHVESAQPADTFPGGLAAGKRVKTGQINHVVFIITAVRCVVDSRPKNKTGVLLNPYPAADLTATAQQTNADAWALWNHLFNMAMASLSPFSLCKEVFFDAMRALPEEGARAGWILVLRVQLDGYEETLSS